MRIRLFDPAAHPRLDDLPWSEPLEDWEHARLVDLRAGLHRHVVRFVEYDGQFYALKELPQRLAEREFRLLRTMNDRGLPVVAAVALVDQRGESDPVLITRYLHYAVPFRDVFRERPGLDVTGLLVESIAILLARLHTAGFLWGDCSLSNALFRRDDLHLSGYALDTETGELHERISDGQRRSDVETAVVNIAGGLADLAAAGELPDSVDPFEVAPQVAEVYDRIWVELHGVSTYDPADPRALDRRLDRMHDLGFAVREAVITEGDEPGSLVFRPAAIVDGYHRHRLHELTGIVAREHQAQRLLEHIREFGSHLERSSGRSVHEEDVVHQWLTDVFDPVMGAIPPDGLGKLERPQLFIEILDRHRPSTVDPTWGLADDPTGGLIATARQYAAEVLAGRPQERVPTVEG